MSKTSKSEDGLLFMLSDEEQSKDDEVTIEFVKKDDKVIIKSNNMITGVVKSDSIDYSYILGLMESINDKNTS